MPIPDVNSLYEIVGRFNLLKARFNRWLYWQAVYKAQYFGDHWSSEVEEGDYQATIPLEALVVDTALALITATPPLLTVVPQDESSDRQVSQADKVERWHGGVDYINGHLEGKDPKKAALFSALVRGLGWIREVAAFPTEWNDADYDPPDDFVPFIQTAINSAQVFFRSGRVPGGIRQLAYESLFTVQDIESEWGVTLKLRQDEKGRFLPKDFTEQRLLVDWWEWQTRAAKNRLYHCVYIVDPPQFVKVPTEMLEYKRIPYYPVACYETDEEKPEERYLSFLFKLKELPHLAEIVISRELRMAEMYIDPIIIIKNASGEPVQFIKQPGSVIEITPEDSISYLQWSGSPPDLTRVRDLLLNLTQLSSFSDPILRQGDSPSMLGKVTDIEQGMFKLTEPIKYFKRALEQLYWHRAQLAYSFSPDKRIPIYGEDERGKAFIVQMTGKQLVRNPRVSVKIKPQLHDQLLADINIATQAVNSKLWSPDMAWDFLGVQDKEATKQAVERGLIEFSEEVLAVKKQLYIQELMKGLEPIEGADGAGGLGLPPSPFGQPPQPSMQPAVQGAGNGVQNAATGTPAGGATPINLAAAMARRIQQQALGPVDQNTTQGR